MKKATRLLVALLALSMIVGMAACSPSQTATDQTPAPTATETAPSTESTPTAAPSEAPQIADYINMDSALPITKEPIQLTAICQRDDANGGNTEDLWFWAFAKKFMNIEFKVEQVLLSAIEERKGLMFASGELPDMIMGMKLTNIEYMKYGMDEGMLLSFNDMIEAGYAPNIQLLYENYPQAKAVTTLPDGKIYTFPIVGIPGNPGAILDKYALINTKWLKELNLEEPKTLDDLLTVLRAFKANAGKGSIPEDVIPFGGADGQYLWDISEVIWQAMGFVVSNTNAYEPALRNGEVTSPLYEKELYTKYLKYMNTLYTEQLISPDYFTLDSAQCSAQAEAGKYGALIYPLVLCMTQCWVDYEALAPMTSEDNSTPVVKKAPLFTLGCFAASAKTEYPEAIMRFCDYLYTKEGGTIFQANGPLVDVNNKYAMGYYKVVVGKNESGQTTIGFDPPENTDSVAFKLGHILPLYPFLGYQDHYMKTIFELNNLGEYKEFTNLDWNPDDGAYQREWYTAAKKVIPYETDGFPNVYLDVETSQRISDLKAVISDYVETETAKFITGQRGITDTEIEKFYRSLEAINYGEYMKAYIDAYEVYRNALE